MIRSLRIHNYALIDHLEIEFPKGFITITGETGAGKSILMGALSLILGQRADTGVLLNKETKCMVEGEFSVDEKFRSFFERNDLDYDPLSLLRREILPGGKSRAFINDTPVVLSQLKSLGDQLVDVHSQHQNLQLNDYLYQMEVVDHVCGNASLLEKYGNNYLSFTKSVSEYQKLRSGIDTLKGELDFYEYQFRELDGAKLSEGELETLETDLSTMEHAEEIRAALEESNKALMGEGQGLTLINEALMLQKKIQKFHSPSESFAGRLESAYIELKDIAREMEMVSGDIDHDQKKLDHTRDRIDLLYSLMQKHKVRDSDELIKLRDELEEKISEITFSDEHLSKLEKKISEKRGKLMVLAEELHSARKEGGSKIGTLIVEMLRQLGIPTPTFRVEVEKIGEPGPFGMDDVRFLFSANKQSAPEEISKVASGGEVSRLMLCIKSLLSDFKGLPTLIFDEIDSGVSGEVAEKVGGIMKRMSGGRQLIAITHLPQVASQGDAHFLVFKTESEAGSSTRIRSLGSDERVNEIAKLLSGEEVTGAAITNARELLKMKE